MRKVACQWEERASPLLGPLGQGGVEELPVTGLGFCLGTWVSVWSLASPHDRRAAGLSRAELM